MFVFVFFFLSLSFYIFFFNDPPTTEIYTLSPRRSSDLRCWLAGGGTRRVRLPVSRRPPAGGYARGDRKSTRLNSSHRCISYAVFCLKKKKTPNLPSTAAARKGTSN